MITKIFSIYDEATQAYMMPFFSPQNASAIRAIVTQLRETESMLAHNPEHFSLYCLGSFNDQNGQLDIMEEHPELIGKMTDYLELSIGQFRQHDPLGDPKLAHREQTNLHGNST